MEKKKILVVDDEPHIVKMVKNRLETNHFEVVTAYNGLECLQCVGVEKPDLIILDISMPRMDGYSVVKELRANAKTAEIPILILTAKEMMRDLLEMEHVSSYLVKPFRSEDLLDHVRKALAAVG